MEDRGVAIALEHVTKRFGKFAAARDVTLYDRRGRVLLAGTASGSKSSLRGLNEKMTKLRPWKVWCDGGGWWIRPVIVSKSCTENVHG